MHQQRTRPARDPTSEQCRKATSEHTYERVAYHEVRVLGPCRIIGLVALGSETETLLSIASTTTGPARWDFGGAGERGGRLPAEYTSLDWGGFTFTRGVLDG